MENGRLRSDMIRYSKQSSIMITYQSTFLGLESLKRVHGSAVYKTFIPAMLSTLYLILVDQFRTTEEAVVEQVYAVGAFVAFFSFLLTFRLNYGYQRYWEAASAVHKMMSKWLDCCLSLAAFHYQSSSFADIRPEALGRQENRKTLGKTRHFHTPSMEETVDLIDKLNNAEEQRQRGLPWWQQSSNTFDSASRYQSMDLERQTAKSINKRSSKRITKDGKAPIPIPMRFQRQFTRPDDEHSPDDPPNLRASLKRAEKAKNPRRIVDEGRIPLPSLFLQELAHLLSLLNAVALSTLRNDMEFAESPIVEYFPGQPWPPKNPDALAPEIRKEFGEGNNFVVALRFCLGTARSPQRRTLYNAARPFAVLGGVSDAEVEMLQRARGSYAKVALMTMWIQEFMCRECMHGSSGAVAPPIISRLYQFLSDGVTGYNEARKVAYIAFPFPHGQTTSFFTVAILFVFPMLYGSFVSRLWFAAFLNFATVLCFLGLHEVARELEDPFINTPNDLPLTTFQAEFNEALVTIYSGFHPDSWWDDSKTKSSSDLSDVEE